MLLTFADNAADKCQHIIPKAFSSKCNLPLQPTYTASESVYCRKGHEFDAFALNLGD